MIRIVFRDSAQIEMFQDDPQWHALTAALDASGRIAIPAAVWQIQVIADGPDAPPRNLLTA